MHHPSFVLFILGTLAALWIWRRFTLRRALQVFSLNLFTVLLWLAAVDGRPHWPVDLFLFSDPLIAVVHTVAGRTLVALLLFSLVFIALAMLMGRIFCSHVCPLGTLFDLSDRWLGRRQNAKTNRASYRRARKAKFVFLLVILAAAVCGFNLLGFGDPIVFFTRFAATIFFPIVAALEDLFLDGLRNLGIWGDRLDLEYMEETRLPSFEGAVFMAGLLVVLLALSRLQPRFWCRHLCPLGGLLAWLGRWAPYRRRVIESCDECQKCVAQCPTGAIHRDPTKTDRTECIVCLQCVQVCPQGAPRFAFARADPAADAGVQIGRRAFVGGTVGGLVLALELRTDILHPSDALRPLPLRHAGLIRPPGALPEPEFLSRCLRCGECMRACPSNTLQPDWYRAGLEGLWAPRMNLRHAACDQSCNVCGQVCPTHAIRPLSSIEKRHAKTGTATIHRNICLPWSQDRQCLICDERCPYGAISLERLAPPTPGSYPRLSPRGERLAPPTPGSYPRLSPRGERLAPPTPGSYPRLSPRGERDLQHSVAVPIVDPEKCNGCGICEDRCPVLGDAAITITPQGELRLAEGSYVAECRERGLVFERKTKAMGPFRVDDSKLPGQVPRP